MSQLNIRVSSSKLPAAVAHCSNIVPDENKNTNNRLDYKIDIYASGYQYSHTNGYGEVKPSGQISPTLLVNDFYRLAIFCKGVLDKHNLKQVLAFQAIGNSITFFSMSLRSHQRYIFTELVRIIVPLKKSNLVDLVGQLYNLVFLFLAHKSHCIPSQHDSSVKRCNTLSSSYLENKGALAPKKHPFGLTLDS